MLMWISVAIVNRDSEDLSPVICIFDQQSRLWLRRVPGVSNDPPKCSNVCLVSMATHRVSCSSSNSTKPQVYVRWMVRD